MTRGGRVAPMLFCCGLLVAEASHAQASFSAGTQKLILPQKQNAAERWSWPLRVMQCNELGTEIVPIPTEPGDSEPLGSDPQLPNRDRQPKVAEQKTRPKYPSDYLSYTWTLSRVRTRAPMPAPLEVVESLTLPVIREPAERRTNPCAATFAVREPGSYVVGLTIERDGKPPLTATKSVPVRRILVVASVGDSFASGEGNPSFNGITKPHVSEATIVELGPFGIGSGIPLCENVTFRYTEYGTDEMPAVREEEWDLEPRAHRSTNAAPALAAASIGNRDDLVAFVSFATSGATVAKGLLQPQHAWQEPRGQLRELAAFLQGRRVDVLLVSIGGNDVGFAITVATLARHGKEARTALIAQFTRDLGILRTESLPLLYEAISNLDPARVYITEYPVGLFNSPTGEVTDGCGLFLTPFVGGISKNDARLIRDHGASLNAELRNAVTRYQDDGWNYVGGIARAFERRGYCSGRSLYVSASASCRKQADFNGLLHPNADGHEAIAARIVAEVNLDLR